MCSEELGDPPEVYQALALVHVLLFLRKFAEYPRHAMLEVKHGLDSSV